MTRHDRSLSEMPDGATMTGMSGRTSGWRSNPLLVRGYAALLIGYVCFAVGCFAVLLMQVGRP